MAAPVSRARIRRTWCWAACALLAGLAATLAPPPVPAQEKPPEKQLVAILPLQPVGISAIHASALTDRLGEELLKSGRYTLVDRSQIEAILDEQALQQSGCTEQECAVQVGQLLGVRRMVAGKVTRIEGDLWLLSAILVDVETAETLRAESVQHSGGYVGLLDRGIAVLAAKLAETQGTPRAAAVPAAPQVQAPPTPPAVPKAEAPARPPAAATPPPAIESPAGDGAAWQYTGAAVLGVFAAVQYNNAVDLNSRAESTAQSDPVNSQRYEDDRDGAAKRALTAGVVAAGLLAWAMAAGDGGPAASAGEVWAPVVVLRPGGSAAGVRVEHHW